MPPMGPSNGKILIIDTVSQSKLNIIKNVNFELDFEKSVLEF